jgi:acetyltransferase-like isoleucine patch superfamily enzyme
MSLKYYIQKLLGLILDKPIVKKTIGYSLVKSEKVDVITGKHTNVVYPFFLHHVVLDDYSYIARNSNATNVRIGKFCSIGPNFCCGLGLHPTDGISTAPMFYSKAKQNGVSLVNEVVYEEQKQTIIGNDVFIGANVTIVDGVKIGDGAVIGAGAVVVKDIPPYAVAVGVPAKVIKYRFNEKIIKRLIEMQWWDWSETDLQKVANKEFNVNDFIK